MNASWWNGDEDRDIPSFHGPVPNLRERVAFQDLWLRERGITRDEMTAAQVIAERNAWIAAHARPVTVTVEERYARR